MRALALSLLLLAARVPAQTPPAQTSAATYRIAGTVLSPSGQHLQHATIKILSNGKTVQTTSSDEFGRFAFTNVPAGNFILQGEAPGYIASFYQEHDGYSTGIITGAGLDTESLALTLRPQGILTGTILDESGDPVQRANIRLYRQSHSFGDSRIVGASGANTDDLGHFEIRQLAPGAYLMAVTATPWYAVHPDPQQQKQQPFNGFVESLDPSLDVAYPTTYYPGTTDQSQATPILIRGGPAEISLRLSPLPALSVTFAYDSRRNEPVGSPYQPPLPQLRTSIFGQLQPVNGEYRVNGNGNQMTLAGLAPGDYVVGDARQGMNAAGGGATLHLTDQSQATSLPAAPDAAHVHVLLKLSDGSAVPNGILVGLERPHSTEFIARQNSAKGEAKFDVEPGDYSFTLCGGGRTCYIRQVISGERALPSNNVHIGSGDQTFTVTFDIGTHTVKGVAQRDGKPCPGVFVLLFPADEVHDIRTALRDQSDLDGSFTFKGLATGAYTVVAIDDGWDLAWQHEEVLSRFLPAAVTVHVGDSPAVQTIADRVPVQAK